MDEVEIDVVELETLEGQVEGLLEVFDGLAHVFCRYEKLLSWHSGFLDRLTELRLIAVDYI